MFCPNCGTQITLAQKFCRGCGFRLEKIVEELALQLPTEAHGALLRRAVLCDKFGVVTLVVFGLIIVIGIVYMSIFGVNFKPLGFIPGILIFITFACGLLSVFFFNYATHLREKISSPAFRDTLEKLPERENSPPLQLEDKFFEPASVTERTTDLLFAEKSKKSGELS